MFSGCWKAQAGPVVIPLVRDHERGLGAPRGGAQVGVGGSGNLPTSLNILLFINHKCMPADGQACHCPIGPGCEEGRDLGQTSIRTSHGGQAGNPALYLGNPAPSPAGLAAHASRLPAAPWLRGPSPRRFSRYRLLPCLFCCYSGPEHLAASRAQAAASARTWRPR